MRQGKPFFPTISSTGLVVIFSLLLVLFYNEPAWNALSQLAPLHSVRDGIFFVSFFFLLWACFVFFLILLSFRPLLKPVLSFLVLGSAFAVYFMNSYGVSIDRVMVQNAFETNAGEMAGLLSLRLALYVLVLGVLPCVLIWKTPVTYRPFLRGLLTKILVVMGCLGVVAISVGAFYSTYAPLFRHEDRLTHFINPSNYIYAVGKYVGQQVAIKENATVTPIGEDAALNPVWRQRAKKSLLVFVMGETARADHFSLNGYARDTNPELKKLDIVNFSAVQSCGTSTAVSVPCLFSNFTRSDYTNRKGKTHEGLLDVLQRAGMSVMWLDNNSDCKGTCLRVPNKKIETDKSNPFCDGSNCLDEALLEGLQTYIDGLEDNAIIVLHVDGSHGPEYYQRYAPAQEHFKPVCRTNQLNTCTQDELINVYDNTIVYTDFFLARLIELLKQNSQTRDTAMIYVSDHGESLGENGIYLHAAPYAIAPAAQTHVPMIMWFGSQTLANWGIEKSCLMDKGAKAFSHDNIFHSVLGLMQVDTSVYDGQLDIFKSCRSRQDAGQGVKM